MKIIKHMGVAVCIIIFSIQLVISAAAHTIGKFDKESIPTDQQENILKNLDVKTMEWMPNASIDSFSMNPAGMIAIGLNTPLASRKTVCVMDSEGNIQYGLTFKCDGSFYVDWDDDLLVICFVRSDIAVSFDSNTQCVGMVSINDPYWINAFEGTQSATLQKYGGKSYCLESSLGIFTTSYSKLVAYDSAGNQQILYKADMEDFTMVFIRLAILISFTVVITKYVKKARHQKGAK